MVQNLGFKKYLVTLARPIFSIINWTTLISRNSIFDDDEKEFDKIPVLRTERKRFRGVRGSPGFYEKIGKISEFHLTENTKLHSQEIAFCKRGDIIVADEG
ncbi:hypothetical protein RCL_jg26859.t1 [Rhizophagus clarus]|uniref:Uncharacterized protein n=1 Tax=Rhizophagus clarus TaxID=94130 RepID=A0A8H3LEF0_9GLOM|nr:hypothetical protein RCL_jg26859.t1 [Rhizophagus clarus]